LRFRSIAARSNRSKKKIAKSSSIPRESSEKMKYTRKTAEKEKRSGCKIEHKIDDWIIL
jgi:hypothetical protein